MIVMGLDPGLRHTGFGLISSKGNGEVKLIESGVISPKRSLELPKRLAYIYSGIAEIISHFSPSEAAIEDIFISVNSKSALKLGHARGCVMVCCVNKGLDVFTYESTLVKKTLVGRGRADKSQVAFMVSRHLDIAIPASQDESDALAIGLCHIFISSTLKRYSLTREEMLAGKGR